MELVGDTSHQVHEAVHDVLVDPGANKAKGLVDAPHEQDETIDNVLIDPGLGAAQDHGSTDNGTVDYFVYVVLVGDGRIDTPQPGRHSRRINLAQEIEQHGADNAKEQHAQADNERTGMGVVTNVSSVFRIMSARFGRRGDVHLGQVDPGIEKLLGFASLVIHMPGQALEPGVLAKDIPVHGPHLAPKQAQAGQGQEGDHHGGR